MKRQLITTPICLLLAAASADLGLAQLSEKSADTSTEIRKRQPTQFVRILEDEFGDPTALQTATASYLMLDEHGETKLEVILESVIHIADRSYFQAFNQRFQHYDVVLYELVAPPEKRIPDRSAASANPMAMIQQLAAKGLGLTHQVSEIDYQAANLVHSDLSPEEMATAMRSRGDDPFTMMADTMLHWMRQTNRAAAEAEESDKELAVFDLAALMQPEGTMKVRRLLAAQFANGADMEMALPPRQRATLISDRNERAMEVFEQQVEAGHRKIALFWGAGHMQDFESRLRLEYELKPGKVRWRNAWDLRNGAVRGAPLESILQETIRGVLSDVTELIPDQE